ncbi:BAHD acyltransferase At5g47980 [Ziziphus jujuba]|uniref:BAHD acyltransferase At5g47980 n=1 Tax=Ziziphus jujuba TaxID=326968 RepID=A0A6P4B6Z0_ZIZJJ|nr:BAHD acyltransferase At5g47980 [Ziziphus jujuba]
MEMKIDIIGKETIKPSSPTPHHLQSFSLSLLDQLAPSIYNSLVFFYPNNNIIDITSTSYKHKSQHLKKSLSQTLTRFYPLAGRFKDNKSIACHDDGVHYIEARCHGLLSSFLQQPEAEALKRFLPVETHPIRAETFTGPLLVVQASFFDCGGLAIGFSITHKLADGGTLRMFIKGWAATALGHGEKVVPEFKAASYFPPSDDLSINFPAVEFKKVNCVSKRFVFDASNLASLKAKASSLSVENPSRVEVVTALIWRCAISARRSNSEFPLLNWVLTHSLNLRKKVEPPLKGARELGEIQAKRFQGNDGRQVVLESYKEGGQMIRRDDINLLICTSLCNFQLYDVDFGWGRPIWVTLPSGSIKNVVSLMDTREGDGVEAWVSLSQNDMGLFEHDPQLLAFGSPNPSVF